MKNYFVNTPQLIKLFYFNRIWNFSRKKKELYLTFDDGPTPEITNWVLTELDKYNAKATFFCLGKNISSHPQIFKKIIDKKHSIGNHTFNHLNGSKSDVITYIEDVIKTQNIIEENAGPKTQNTKLFRPPYGRLTPKQAKKIRKLDYKVVMWDILSADFDQSISPEKCLSNVIKSVKRGSIIVFHDSIKAKQNLQFVLPQILEYYHKRGCKFKAIN